MAASATPPQPATLGPGGEDWQRWLLWTVLGMGTALVLAVSPKALRQP